MGWCRDLLVLYVCILQFQHYESRVLVKRAVAENGSIQVNTSTSAAKTAVTDCQNPDAVCNCGCGTRKVRQACSCLNRPLYKPKSIINLKVPLYSDDHIISKIILDLSPPTQRGTEQNATQADQNVTVDPSTIIYEEDIVTTTTSVDKETDSGEELNESTTTTDTEIIDVEGNGSDENAGNTDEGDETEPETPGSSGKPKSVNDETINTVGIAQATGEDAEATSETEILQNKKTTSTDTTTYIKSKSKASSDNGTAQAATLAEDDPTSTDEDTGENTDEETGEETSEDTNADTDEETGEDTSEGAGEKTGEDTSENTGEDTGENTGESGDDDSSLNAEGAAVATGKNAEADSETEILQNKKTTTTDENTAIFSKSHAESEDGVATTGSKASKEDSDENSGSDVADVPPEANGDSE